MVSQRLSTIQLGIFDFWMDSQRQILNERQLISSSKVRCLLSIARLRAILDYSAATGKVISTRCAQITMNRGFLPEEYSHDVVRN